VKLNDILDYSFQQNFVKIGSFNKIISPKKINGNFIIKSPNLKKIVIPNQINGNMIIEGNFQQMYGYLKSVKGNITIISPSLKSLKWLPLNISGNHINIQSNNLNITDLKYLFYIENIFFKKVDIQNLQKEFEFLKRKLFFTDGINSRTKKYIIDEFFKNTDNLIFS
jgi:hypothetical protein